tara:strand:- start:418 stop:765 length:348 start_codon:yes stop_codon:yes gene_type:complete
MTDFQIYSEGKKVSTIRMGRYQSAAIFQTEFWKDVDQIAYTWIDEDDNEYPIEVISLADDLQRWKLIEGLLVCMLGLGRSTLVKDSAPIKPREFSGLMELFESLSNMNVDGIRVG